MPVNNALNINFTNIIKRNNHAVAFSTSVPNGNLYKQKNKIVKSTKIPPTNLNLELVGTWADYATMRVRTNGSLNFGDVGPNLLMYLDASRLPLGPINTLNEASVQRSASTNIYYGTTSKFTVVSHPGLPGGKGIQDGALDSTLNSTNNLKMWCFHEPHTRGFEMRCNIWDQTAQDLMATYITTQGANNLIFQEKGIWNMANGHYGGTDTNLFYGGPWRGYGTGTHGSNGPALLTSNSLVQIYGIVPPVIPRPADFPPVDSVTYEYTYDQYAANEIAKGYVHVRQYNESMGVHVDASFSDYLMCIPSGPYRVINSFSYPGFVRGYNIPLGLNRHDGFIYKTNGAGAHCRVILSNNSNYKLSTKTTPLTILDWTRYDIAFEARPGWFNLANLTGVFLNIIGADNEQIAYIAL